MNRFIQDTFALTMILLLAAFLGIFYEANALFARETESREVKILNGLWNFRADNSSRRNAGFEQQWYKEPLKKKGSVIKMPVPSSYNDITQDRNLRDFVGWAWYDHMVYVPKRWDDEENLRVVLLFESCHYYCAVWVNGEKVVSHEGGHLPFDVEVTQNLNYGTSNLITVAANNTLTPKTLPPGTIEYMDNSRKYPPGYFVQNLQMDFFNYAGIHRPVKLYVTPTVFLLDVTLNTNFHDTTGMLTFKSSVAALDNEDAGDSKNENISMTYEIYDANEKVQASLSGNNLFKGSINVSNVQLWWPVDMDQTPGYMYTLKVTLNSSATDLIDIYRLPFGFRTVDVDDKNFFINKKPFYFKGFGMHEDSDIRGKGLDLPVIMKNFNLITWMGANSFRTSHYPYADEIMDLADQQGIVVIDECPGVGIYKENMAEDNIAHHKEVMKELIHRDKNHPSVVMWSVANEPESQYEEADAYFKAITSYTRELDNTRPVTFVGNQSPYDDKAVKYNDVICYNHYYSWYHDYGHLELITYQATFDLENWHNITKKPVILSEYGADAVAGLHANPSVMFTEDYQVDSVKRYFPVFDKYKGNFFVGEMIWNFADFETAQDVKRVAGNKKGIFTRQRQPKHVAYVLRERYKSLSSLILDTAVNASSRELDSTDFLPLTVIEV